MPKGKGGRKGKGNNQNKNNRANNKTDTLVDGSGNNHNNNYNNYKNKNKNNSNHNNTPNSNNNNNNNNNNNDILQQSQSHVQAEQLREQGNKEFTRGHFDRAVDYYSRALKEDTGDFRILANRSAAYVALEEFSLALQDAQGCLQLSPKWWKGHVRLANVYSEQKLFEDAQKILLEAMNICEEQQPLHKALHDMDIKRINTLHRADRIVGGYHPQAENFRVMFNWLLEHGGKLPKLYLKFFTAEFRAINALDRILKDEDVMYVPHDCIMTSDIAKASDLGKAITNSGIELRSKHSYLAGYLCQEREKGKDSHWFPYIDILPNTFENVPIYFDKEKLDMLKGSIAIKKIEDRIESLRAEYDNICAHVPEFRTISHKDFVWARLVVITRIFGLVIDDNKTDGLVPLADMLNHKRPRETKWNYDQKRRGFVVTALQTIPKDGEVFDSYGRKCNSRFFVNYGFSLEENEDNEASLIFELAGNDPQYQLKARYLGFNQLDRPQREFQIPRQYKEKKVKECLSWLRVAHAQDNELMIITTSNFRTDDIPPISLKNELAVLTALAVAAKKSLNLFDTTLEEDNKLLEDEEKYPKLTNMRNIVLMRRGEKEVLHFYVDLLKECKPLLQMTPTALKQKFRQEKNKWKTDSEDPLVQYVLFVVEPLVAREKN